MTPPSCSLLLLWRVLHETHHNFKTKLNLRMWLLLFGFHTFFWGGGTQPNPTASQIVTCFLENTWWFPWLSQIYLASNPFSNNSLCFSTTSPGNCFSSRGSSHNHRQTQSCRITWSSSESCAFFCRDCYRCFSSLETLKVCWPPNFKTKHCEILGQACPWPWLKLLGWHDVESPADRNGWGNQSIYGQAKV